jgi:hypothetical protein
MINDMATPKVRKRTRSSEARVSRTYRLPLSKIRAAQRALGAATATEAIERALDEVTFKYDLIEGSRRMFGIHITSPDPPP